jgi:hypothetical protein
MFTWVGTVCPLLICSGSINNPKSTISLHCRGRKALIVDCIDYRHM